ncbi:hypothetical protein [Salicibibacter cibarius]|nr:hypothetical protein [Salicibibacter cibarius]
MGEQILEQLELVDVENDGNKAVLTFLDEDNGEIREVNFNKQSFDQDKGKFVDDPDKAEKVEEWSQEYFNLPFDQLGQAVGDRKDVYAYDRFNALWPVKMISKFSKDDEGQIFETEVTKVHDDGKAMHIEFEYEGDTYESKMTYADYLEAKKQWFVNPQKQKKQYAKFEDKFGISPDNMEELEGKSIMVEVKVAFGKFPYAEIKPFAKKKK